MMGLNSADTIIVGGGVMGCAAAYQLAKDGQRVLLLEQDTVGNHNGSSHGSRLFRLAHTSRDYVELAREASSLWKQLEDDAGVQLLQKSYGLDFGTAEDMERMRLTLMEARVPFEPLNGAEIMQRFPQFSLPEGTLGLYQDSYALLDAGKCVATFAAQARRHRAEILEHQAVERIQPGKDGVLVLTRQNSYSAAKVIICAGSWMRPLIRWLEIDLPLVVRNEVVTYFMPSNPSEWIPGRFPLFRHHMAGTDARWGVGFPSFGRWGVKVVLDCTGPVVDPSDPDRTPDPLVVSRIRQYATSLLPGLGDDLLEAETCRYTLTPDEDFILDRHPAYPQIVIASPCSGHGFKFAPLIGRILADLAVKGETRYPIERFRLQRPGLAAGNG